MWAIILALLPIIIDLILRLIEMFSNRKGTMPLRVQKKLAEFFAAADRAKAAAVRAGYKE